ncbi:MULTISPECIES: hypothetical protein [Bacillus subtilis group]|uniref:Uncharacterized protein n=1 Tax=Bacillus subtilis TaxID=1423 RepID=A0AAQ3ESE7_BACIU|nr:MULTISPECIES: hypothetical protein [Bacillus subtilis group]USY31710.1 hypothetical protein NIZ95_13180 [Bacillus velezensis]WHM22400.1 hypothetical protein QL281_04805 [Bacillus subtilis]
MKPLGELVINTNIEIEGGMKRTMSTRVSDRDVVRISAEELEEETCNDSVTIESIKDEGYAP